MTTRAYPVPSRATCGGSYGDRVPDRAGRDGGGGAGRAAADEAARGRGGGDPGRLPDAGTERDRVPRAGHGHLPERAAGAAHRLRRHRRGHRRDQRRRPRSLPAQAVGPAGGEAVPGPRRAARRVADLGSPAGAGDQGGRAPLVGPVVGGPRVPGAQPGALPLVRVRRAGRAAAAGRGGRGRAGAAAGDHAGRRSADRADRRRAGRAGRAGHHPGQGLLRPDRDRRRAGRAGRGGVRRVRGPAHRAGRAHWPPAARPGRARGSRTTWASRTGCPGRS